MNFVWAGNREEVNSEVKFSLNLKENCDTIKICAADFFRVVGDGEFLSYGPDRTAAGFTRPKIISLKNVKKIDIYVLAYNTPCYACDFQLPFFGAEVYSAGKVVYNTYDFSASKSTVRDKNVPRYSPQRGFMESYNFINAKNIPLDIYEVDSPREIDSLDDVCDYKILIPTKKSLYNDFHFKYVYKLRWAKKKVYAPKKHDFDLKKDFVKKIKKDNYFCDEYILNEQKTAIFKIEIEAEQESDIFIFFSEIVENDWIVRRSGCNDIIKIKVPRGKTKFICAEPYSFKYFRIVYNYNSIVKPSLILIENDRVDTVTACGDEKIVTIFEAARNTFRQNALDIFMDCPGRERAGWLCDSFFMAKTEQLFTGKNDIEKSFLYNFLICDTPEIPKDMFPKCFPSEHLSKEYIPNWAMWYIIELKDYLSRTGDIEFINMAKEKVYKLIRFFDKYLNEYGLLEDLESWVFIEWSICNSKPYIEGVNFPSNMLFAYMLETVSDLYDDIEIKKRSEMMKKTIKELSFNGEFFVDNAIRVKGKLVRKNKHISETCQYYALFTGIDCDKSYKEKIVKEFGPKRTSSYQKIGKSNMFIGYYLRLFWLCDRREYNRVANECLDYFYDMAKKTGTLWEHNSSKASCNHGFASCLAVLLLKIFTGYEGVKDNSPVFAKNFKNELEYKCNFKFNYKN